MSSDVMTEIFQLKERNHYHLRQISNLWPIQSNESESASHLGPRIWESIFSEIKAIESLGAFKENIKKCNLVTGLVNSARFPLAMSVLFKTNP